MHAGASAYSFNYNPPIRAEDLSPRSASPLSSPSTSQPHARSPEPFVTPDTGSFQKLPTPEAQSRQLWERNSESSFTIHEIHEADVEHDSDDALSVVHPDNYEDALSDVETPSIPEKPLIPNDLDTHLLADVLEQLNCDGERESWKQKERRQRRKKRMNSGSIHKRTLSQSIGSDTDDEDIQPPLLDDVTEPGVSARRLRRKMDGDRTSLIFDDPPQRILELDEPESEIEGQMNVIPPDVDPDVEEVLMQSLPYYEGDSDSMMELDSDDDHISVLTSSRISMPTP